MPELPEVETTRRSFAQRIAGATVTDVRLGKPLRWPLGCTPASLRGRRVGQATRRGKYLWLPVGEGGLLLHLGMSGSLALLAAPGEPGPHDHFDLATDRGTLRLTDPRRFGAVVYTAALDQPPAARLLARLGAEPFDTDYTAQALHRALRRRRAPIKAVLLAGDVVVGAGNIYACEALHRAAIHPSTRSDRISAPRAAALLGALRTTLARALALGGSTLRLTDPRRFGAVLWSRSLDVPPAATRLGGLGLEPFDPAFTGEYLHRALRGRRVAIKQALLAGDIVVGAGNIYACEALFRAGIAPRTAAGRVSRPRCERLAEAVRHILAQALDLGGSTLRDYRDAHGMAGSFQQHAAVYGREGQPCRTCGTPVRRIVQGQRSSFFCPHCQRR